MSPIEYLLIISRELEWYGWIILGAVTMNEKTITA